MLCLLSAGCKILDTCSEYEVLRYTAWDSALPAAKKPTTNVIYRKRDGRVTFTNASYRHYMLFIAGQEIDDQSRQSVLETNKSILLSKARKLAARVDPVRRSWTQKTRLLLHERDGDDCYFCCAPLTYMSANHLRGSETVEHLYAQSLALAAGWRKADVNHIDNLVLAHARCNREAGHKTVDEKKAIREMHKAGLHSNVPWWQEDGFISDAPRPVHVNPRPRKRVVL